MRGGIYSRGHKIILMQKRLLSVIYTSEKILQRELPFASTLFTWHENKTTILEQSSRKWGLTRANMRSEARYVWMCTLTPMTPQFHGEEIVFIFRCGLAMFVDFLYHINWIPEEWGIKWVPMLLILEMFRVKILADHMKVQLSHWRGL